MPEIEDVGTLLEPETGPQIDSPGKSDIDVVYEKRGENTNEDEATAYEVSHYDGVEEEFYEELSLDFETSAEQVALDRENERAVFHNTDDTYDVLEVVEASSGKIALKGQIYGQEDTWALVYNSDKQELHGKNMSTGVRSEIDDSNLMNKAEILKRSIVGSERMMERQLRSEEYTFKKTERMKEDFERIPHAENKIWEGQEPSGKLKDVKNSLDSLSSVKPREIFTKECTGPMKPGLQLVYDGYRFIFQDGSRTDGLENKTFYGIRAFSKNRSEQREFADELLERDENFNEYAERVLREEGLMN
jgi:hypothetical protein